MLRNLTLLGVLLAVACSPNPNLLFPGSPGFVTVEAPSDLANASFKLLPGDTLRYPLAWGAAPRATSYQLTVTSTGAGWTGLPTNLTVNGTSFTLVVINTSLWDTTTFTASVRGVNQFGVGKTQSATWRVQRGPGSPGPITVDSSLIQLSLFIKPDSVKVETTKSVQFCAFFLGLDGIVRMAEGQNVVPACQQWYDAFPPSQTLPGYPVAFQPRALQPIRPTVVLTQVNGYFRPRLVVASGS